MGKVREITLVSIICVLVIISGCSLFKKKKVVTTAPEQKVVTPKEIVKTKPKPQPIVQKKSPPPPTPEEIYRMNYHKLPTSHTVVKGECLWWIAEYKQIYNDPFMWPLIYKANRDKIKDPDLIYPGQVFRIPREFSLEELKISRKSAGAPRPYLPPKNANIPANLRVKLNWEF